tara:strand:+ start:65 stop:1081 length:1017 start_codon:yes stop_codon:yes gene_type:complete
MSSLLEQAIIDAAALKEAAIKNAETAILNKYSADIKEVVENLFEQEEGLDAEEGAQDDLSSDESPALADSIPMGLEAPTASEETEIVLSMEELKDMADALAAADEDLIGEPTPHEDLANEILPEPPSLSGEMDVPEASIEATLEEEVEINAEDLTELIEELVVDIDPKKSGWAGTPESIMDHKEQLRLAQLAATKAHEENMELVAARDRLSEQNEQIEGKMIKLSKALTTLKETFDKVNLSNARLLYTNRVLTNSSLNERQKSKIVEALSNADSINDAKVIFETLESAVGSVTGKAQPQSLRETIERPTATLPRREAKTRLSPVTDRMQILAGIKKLK